MGNNPTDTFENTISGPALTQSYGKNPRELPADHPAWEKVSKSVGHLAAILGLMNGVQLVVPCGGVGAGASDNYNFHLNIMISDCREHGNATQALFLPEIIPVPAPEAQVFEVFGG